VLVGVDVWTDGDLINVNDDNIHQTLVEFCDYRKINISRYHNNDNAQLLAYVLYSPVASAP